ncbi:MAG: hypothetical protein NT069_08405, partial [Planctomycetota bacterium]|nr:hypothetical protein [Planctomycetota bacterium]
KTEVEADDDDNDDDRDDDDDDEKQKGEKRGSVSRKRENAPRYETIIQLSNPKAAMKSIDKINQSIRRRHPKVPGLGVEAKLHASGEIHLSGSPGEVAMLEVLLPLIDAKVSEREENSPRRAPRVSESAEILISELSPQARVKLLRIDVAAAKKELEASAESVERTQKQVDKGYEPLAQLRAANRELEQARFRLERLEVQLEDLETRPEREARAADEAAKLRATQRAKRGTARLKLKELDLRTEEQEFTRLVEELEQAQKLRDKGLIPETELQVKRAGLNASRQKVERAKLHLDEAREELESDSDLPVSR